MRQKTTQEASDVNILSSRLHLSARIQEYGHQNCSYLLRSVDLWVRKCVKSRTFLLRRHACLPLPSAAHAIPNYPKICTPEYICSSEGICQLTKSRGPKIEKRYRNHNHNEVSAVNTHISTKKHRK